MNTCNVALFKLFHLFAGLKNALQYCVEHIMCARCEGRCEGPLN